MSRASFVGTFDSTMIVKRFCSTLLAKDEESDGAMSTPMHEEFLIVGIPALVQSV
jgi:hypothetical protein